MSEPAYDYLVTVCDVCRCASCWHGEFYCDAAQTAGLVRVPASVLCEEKREHPDHFSPAKIERVCGEKPTPIEECRDCDGCGWYEGGPTLQTRCEKCGGSGVVSRSSS